MDFSVEGLATSLLLGAVGTGLFLYGKKQARLPQLLAGILLMVVPAFVSGVAWNATIGAAVVGVLWFGIRAGVF